MNEKKITELNEKDLFSAFETAPGRARSGLSAKIRNHLTAERTAGKKITALSAEMLGVESIGAGSLYAVVRDLKCPGIKIIKRVDSHHALEAIVKL